MKALNFAKRNLKEIIRDPLSTIFSILLPLFLLFIFQQFKIPNQVYNIENFTPGIIVFGFSFITLFCGVLVAKDRGSSLLARLCAGPMKTFDYILGYTLCVIPVVALQNLLFFITAFLLGLEFSINTLFTALISLPISILFIHLGILIGCLTTEKSASGISSVVVQLVAFTGGMYFSGDMIGDGFNLFCKILPFYHSVNVIKGVLNKNYTTLAPSVFVLVIYILAVALITVFAFRKKMKSN